MIMERATSTVLDTEPRTGLAAVRGVEAAELLRVVTSLRLDGLLTEAEYRTKRQRLLAAR